jgi:hypothetical protein
VQIFFEVGGVKWRKKKSLEFVLFVESVLSCGIMVVVGDWCFIVLLIHFVVRGLIVCRRVWFLLVGALGERDFLLGISICVGVGDVCKKIS